MGNCLAEMDDWLKELAYSKRILHFTVICTAILVDLDSPKSNKKELAKWWGTDPIHMLPAGYSKVAEKLTDRIEKEQQEEQERKPQHRAGHVAEAGLSHQQREGIGRSDVSAKRHGGTYVTGGTRATPDSSRSGMHRWNAMRRKRI